MNDYLVRALTENEEIRAFAVTARNLVEEARKIHDNSPIAIAALGRTLSAALIMGDMLKSEKDLITIHIQGDGPLKQVLATANNKGEVKGYVSNPEVILPPNAAGHLNVGGAIGKGVLTVIKDYGLKEPYVSQVRLVTGEIAEDLTYYFAQSEQTPTAIGLGVLLNKDVMINQAGGFLIQLMPHASEKTVSTLEDNLKKFHSVTDVYRQGKTPEDLLSILLSGLGVQFLERKEVRFACHCSKEKGLQALATLGTQTLKEIVEEGKEQEVSCEFCGKKYVYGKDDIQSVLSALEKNQKEKGEQ